MCTGQLIKFRDVHRLSLNAISDVVNFTKMLHAHYVTQAQSRVQSICTETGLSHFCQADVQKLLDCLDFGHPFEGIQSLYHLQNQMAKGSFYVVS